MSEDFVRIEARVTALERGQESLRALVDENTRITKQVRDNTHEIVEAFKAAKGAFTVAEWVGKVAKWVAAVGAAGAVLWALFKGFGK